MNGWQVTIIVLVALDLLINLYKDGQPKGNYNFLENVVANAIMLWLLYMAGTFN